MPDTSLPDNPRVRVGHNGAPLSPLEIVTQEVENLYGESALWLDGAVVDSQELADGIAHLLTMLRAADKRADETRKIEKQPHLNAAKAVDEAYKPVIDKAKLAIESCKAALKPWLEQQAAEKRAAAERARQEAEAKTQAARAAIRATDGTNLEARAAAEELVTDAKQAERVAARVSNDTAKAGKIGRAVALRTSYRAEITDAKEFARHVWQRHREELIEFLTALAQRQVTKGQRELPGVTVHTEQKAV